MPKLKRPGTDSPGTVGHPRTAKPPGTFLGRDPASVEPLWSEDKIQMFIIQQARRIGITITGSMEQGKRSPSSGSRGKAMGMTAGMPDMLVWLPQGQIKGIELKTTTGRLSDVQHEFHKTLKALGHMVTTIYATCPADGWRQVQMELAGLA